MNDHRYIIIGRSSCPFCIMSVDLLIAKGYDHVFLDYLDREDVLEDYKDFHQQKTVPIILANNKTTGHTYKVGGYSDLLEHQIGK